MHKTSYHSWVLRAGAIHLLLLLSLMIAAPARAVDLTITSGQDISLEGELNYDTVNIGSGGKLRLAAGSRLTCYRLYLSGRLIISGVAEDIAASTTGTAAGGTGGDGGIGGYGPEPLCYRGDAGAAGVTGDDGVYAPQTTGEAFSAQLSASPSITLPGGVVQYTVGVTAKNNETGVTVSLPLPAHTTFVDAGAGYSLNGGTISWNVGDLSPCQLKSLWVRLRMDVNLAGGDVVPAQALATRSTGAADMSDTSEVKIKSDGLGLRDAILALKIMAQLSTAGYDVDSAIDVDGDRTIGLPEAIFILQKLSGDR